MPFCAFAPEVRLIVYTTNAIEALNAKLLFLVLNRAEKAWKTPARKWAIANAQFAVLFGERFTRAMA